MFDFLKKSSKYVVFAFFAIFGFSILYEFCCFISDCSNGSDALDIIADLFQICCLSAFLGLAIYAFVKKKEKLLTLIFSAFFIYTILMYYFNGEFFFRYMDYLSNDRYSGGRKVYYVFLALQKLVLFAFAISIFLHCLKKNETVDKVSTILGLVNVVISIVLFILTIVLVTEGTVWYSLISGLGTIVTACWLTLAVNHPKYLGTENEASSVEEATTENVEEATTENVEEATTENADE